VQTATFSGILASLSVALDLASGNFEGHAVRTGIIAARLAAKLDCPRDDIARVYFAAMLKDIGCIDLRHRLNTLLKGSGVADDYIRAVSHPTALNGACVAEMLGFDDRTVQAILNQQEHWDGSGSPFGKRSENIQFLGRILAVAQFIDAGLSTTTIDHTFIRLFDMQMVWFDPMIVQEAMPLKNDKELHDILQAYRYGWIKSIPMPSQGAMVTGANIDAICEAFSMVIDAQSSFTGDHSARVTHYATWLAQYFNFDPARMKTIRRAALLHDIGKLRVPKDILEKPTKLSRDEFDIVKKHPRDSESILMQIPGFERIAQIAGAHHERLDGKGYYRGIGAEDLDLDMRVLAAADVFDALTATRPYRGRMTVTKALDIMREEAGKHLDEDCVGAFHSIFSKKEYLAA
jgi:putative nucleotidyltransferase with HDIG domain